MYVVADSHTSFAFGASSVCISSSCLWRQNIRRCSSSRGDHHLVLRSLQNSPIVVALVTSQNGNTILFFGVFLPWLIRSLRYDFAVACISGKHYLVVQCLHRFAWLALVKNTILLFSVSMIYAKLPLPVACRHRCCCFKLLAQIIDI